MGKKTPGVFPGPLPFLVQDLVLIKKLHSGLERENTEGCGFFLFFPQRSRAGVPFFVLTDFLPCLEGLSLR